MNPILTNKIVSYFQTQPVEQAWVFGSFARNEETENSDIDILISFSKDSKITLFRYIHMVNDLKAITGKNIDLVENGKLKDFAKTSAESEKILIDERKILTSIF